MPLPFYEFRREIVTKKILSFALLLALLCGLRLGEIGALTLDDIDWKNGRIDISRALKYTSATGQYIAEPKTDTSERVIDLPAGMMTILHVIRDYQVETAALLGDRWRGTGRILINFVQYTKIHLFLPPLLDCVGFSVLAKCSPFHSMQKNGFSTSLYPSF